MTVRVATVLSAREWEPGLVAHARDSASLRIVLRAFQPNDIDRRTDEIDVVVAGGDVSWVTPAHIASWRTQGLSVVGIYPVGDKPSAQLLESGGANEVLPDSVDVAALVQAVRFVAPEVRERPGPQQGKVVAVVGARGAPGCTEVAIAYSCSTAPATPCVLIDLDLDAPSVAVRLGLSPRPDITDVVDAIRSRGVIDPALMHKIDDLAVITGSHRPNEPGLKDVFVEGVVRSAASRFREVVLDLGTTEPDHPLLVTADACVLVVDATALGIVRAAQLVSRWMGPAPALVLNRVENSDRAQMVEATRKWTGLEPAVVIPARRQVRRAAIAG
ncbi:MAG: AAA family ATPase, partial [Acidimicrobiia bacterium]